MRWTPLDFGGQDSAVPKSATPSFKAARRWNAIQASGAIAALKSSGLSMAAFARREGLDSNRLRKWAKKLEPSTALAAAPTFVEVTRVTNAHIEVVMPSGLTLRIAETIDAVALARIVHALESAAQC